MPPQKPVGNGYYGYEDVSHLPGNGLENAAAGTGAGTPDDQSSTNAENDFAEYLWMENEEEFDKQVMQQLEEEELMEQCLEAMLEEEHNNITDDRTNRTSSQCSEISEGSEILNLVNNFKLDLVDVAKSTLNPLAAEFVPDARTTPPVTSTE